MQILKRQHFVHKGQTKFYELVALWNESSHTGVLVKRWGKNEENVVRGYGQSLICECLSMAQLSGEFNTESNNRHKREYVPSTNAWHLADPRMSFTELTAKDIQTHYLGKLNTGVKVSDRILNALRANEEAEIVSENSEPYSPPAPKYDEWGAW